MKHFAWNDLRDIVTVQGRTWEHEDNLYFNWSSSGFTVRFRGSALLAEFSAQSSEEYDGIPGDPNTPHRTVWPWISVFVDDNDQPCRTFELTNKSTKYLIYSGTDEQEHTVRVVKLTENIKTGLSLHSFDVDGEILMPVVEPIKKRIEFVGDSITCGFGLGTSEKDRFYYPQEENVWMAHGPTAARCLGMDWQMICISGICLAPRKEIWKTIGSELKNIPLGQTMQALGSNWKVNQLEIGDSSLYVTSYLNEYGITYTTQTSVLSVILIAIVALGCSAAIIFYTRRQIIKPMKDMTEKLHDMNGVTEGFQIQTSYGSQEFLVLRDTFNRMMRENVDLRLSAYKHHMITSY